MENVNIRLARWEIAHFANHKHPHVSLQHKGVLGNWGGPEAGDTSEPSGLVPQTLLAKVLGGWIVPPQGSGLVAAPLCGIRKSSVLEKVLPSLGRSRWCGP